MDRVRHPERLEEPRKSVSDPRFNCSMVDLLGSGVFSVKRNRVFEMSRDTTDSVELAWNCKRAEGGRYLFDDSFRNLINDGIDLIPQRAIAPNNVMRDKIESTELTIDRTLMYVYSFEVSHPRSHVYRVYTTRYKLPTRPRVQLP